MIVNTEAIFLSILISLLKYFSTNLCKFLTNLKKLFKSETNEYKIIYTEILQLKQQQNAIDQVNNFVDYALIQRKINKLQEKLDKEKNSLRTITLKQTMYIKFFYNSLIVILSLYLIWNNKNKPIIDFTSLVQKTLLNETLSTTTTNLTIFYPFDFLFSFPNLNLTNSIGVTIWLFITNRFLDILFNKLAYFFKPKQAQQQVPLQEPFKINDDMELD
jgi:hypothetical protein